MKKTLMIFLMLLFTLSFAGCDSARLGTDGDNCGSAKIEISEKDGLAYLTASTTAPKMILQEGMTATEIKDSSFLGKLINAINGKEILYTSCYCPPIYAVDICDYYFGIYENKITISTSSEKRINNGAYIFDVECAEEEIDALLVILDHLHSAKSI